MKKPADEIIVRGLTGSEGIAIGPVLVLDTKKREIYPKKISLSEVEWHKQKFSEAQDIFISELVVLSANLDKNSHEIIGTQKEIALDPEIARQIHHILENEQISVDYAVYDTFSTYTERLKESGSDLFQQRIIDLEHIRDRIVDIINQDDSVQKVKPGSILIAKEISPTDLVAYHKKGIVGLVLERGGVTSHASIISESLGIPCLIGAKQVVKSAISSKQAIIDPAKGLLILNPSRETLSGYRKQQKRLGKEKRFESLISKKNETLDGFPFRLLANIEFEMEIDLAKKYQPDGIGLLRTEALLFSGIYKQREGEQDKYYDAILSKMDGPVVIRLFDVGGDKLNLYTIKEANPFLGWRGIRLLLDEKEMFHNQLRSLLKCAGKYPGRIKILVPMVTLVEEIREVRKAIERVQHELINEGLPVDETIPLGIMVEVPSTALLANHFAKEVDFFSIGTNDLTQYTLAVDRGNNKITHLYQQLHPSVWKLIEYTVNAAEENGIDVSVCGELAGDVLGASCLLGMGISDLSMTFSSIPKVKEALTTRSKKEFSELSRDVLSAATTPEVIQIFKEWNNK